MTDIVESTTEFWKRRYLKMKEENELLRSLLYLTHESVSDVEMNEVTIRQIKALEKKDDSSKSS